MTCAPAATSSARRAPPPPLFTVQALTRPWPRPCRIPLAPTLGRATTSRVGEASSLITLAEIERSRSSTMRVSAWSPPKRTRSSPPELLAASLAAKAAAAAPTSRVAMAASIQRHPLLLAHPACRPRTTRPYFTDSPGVSGPSRSQRVKRRTLLAKATSPLTRRPYFHLADCSSTLSVRIRRPRTSASLRGLCRAERPFWRRRIIRSAPNAERDLGILYQWAAPPTPLDRL